MKTTEKQRTWGSTVTEDDKEYIIELELCGVSKEDVQPRVQVQNQTLIVHVPKRAGSVRRRARLKEESKSFLQIILSQEMLLALRHHSGLVGKPLHVCAAELIKRGLDRPQRLGSLQQGEQQALFVGKGTDQAESSEGPKSSTKLTRAERASMGTTKALEAAAAMVTIASKKEGNAPFDSEILRSFINDWESFLELTVDEKFFADHAFEMARLSGEASKLELLEEAGPMLTVEQVAKILKRSRQAVHKRLKSGSLFGMMRQGEVRIPAWQIREGEVVTGIAKVLKNLDTTDWGKMLFLHSANMQLEGRRPMDLILEGDADSVSEVAALFGEQGAK
jgi:hypothetical protein